MSLVLKIMTHYLILNHFFFIDISFNCDFFNSPDHYFYFLSVFIRHFFVMYQLTSLILSEIYFLTKNYLPLMLYFIISFFKIIFSKVIFKNIHIFYQISDNRFLFNFFPLCIILFLLLSLLNIKNR